MKGQSTEELRAPSGEGVTVLRYRPGFPEVIRFFWSYPVIFGLVALPVSAFVKQPALFLIVSAAITGCLILLVLSFDVVVREDSVQFREILGLFKARVIPLEDIWEVRIASHSLWTTARIAVVPESARRRRFFSFAVKDTEIPIRGDTIFQARVLKELLVRREDIPVTDQAAKLLAGNLGVSFRHRVPTLALTGLGMAFLTFLLAVSILRLAPSMAFVFPAIASCLFVPFAACLERESAGKAALAWLGVYAPALVVAAFGGAYAYGGLEYVPMVFAAGIAVTAGGFLAALPTKLRALPLAIGEAALAGALVLVAWSATLRGTIPVQELFLAPAPDGGCFSRDGDTLVLGGSLAGERALHFLDVHARQVRTVPIEGGGWMPACFPVNGGRALYTERERQKCSLWIASVGGEIRELFSAKLIWILRSGLSPDGDRFVFVATEDKPGAEEARKTGRNVESESWPVILDLETLQLQSLDFARQQDLRSLRWRADERLVWGTIGEREAGGAGVFSLWSWAPGEKEARLEFESDEPWSCISVSPSGDRALATVREDDAEVRRIVHFADGRSVDVPPVRPPGLSVARWWGADGRILVGLPEGDCRAVVVMDTDTGETSVAYESPFGEIREPALSPDADRVAFCVAGGWAAAAYVTDLRTGRTHRLRPITLPLSLGGPSLTGSVAWSPSGDLLALTAYCHPPSQMHLHGASAVWLADVP